MKINHVIRVWQGVQMRRAWESARRHASQWSGRMLDFCYPRLCAGCQQPAASSFLCADCARLFSRHIHAPACIACAMPLTSDAAPCPYCRGRSIAPFQRIIRLGNFDDPIRSMIHQVKYHRRWPVGELLADALIKTERAKGLLTEIDAIVPVPLHFRRHLSRGYNQADVIARQIGRKNGIPVIRAARRIRNTETQTQLHSHADRLINVRGAFSLRGAAGRLRGKHVLVIDDVMTTGATIKAVGNLLKTAEPASLCAMVIAVADPRGRGFERI